MFYSKVAAKPDAVVLPLGAVIPREQQFLYLLPLALSNAQWFPLCMSIIFGLVSATAIALLVVPGLYLQLTSDGSADTAEPAMAQEK